MQANPFTLILDALLRPERLIAFLVADRRASGWLVLAVGEVLMATGGFIALVAWQVLSLGARGLAAGLLLAPLMAVMFAVAWSLIGKDARLSPWANAVFWLARCQIAVTPPLALFLALAWSNTFGWMQQSLIVAVLLLALVGVWAGGALTVALVKHSCRAEALATRWLLAAGALIVGGLLWWSPPLRASEALLFAPVCAGLAAGLLRPLSYVWEAGVSVALLAASWLGVPAIQLLRFHPVRYDDLCLLPLPGLPRLLACACATDRDLGGEWLLRVARHSGQRRAAIQAINCILKQQNLAHPLLFWLSTSADGAALLRDLAEQSSKPQPLICAYAAFASTTAPEAWPTVLTLQRAVLKRAANLPGGDAMLALLEAGVVTLRADRWPVAIAGLRTAPAPRDVEDDPVWVALDIITEWANDRLPQMATDRAAALQALWAELQDLEGWPAALIAALSEHLLFLLRVEQHRGAWLA